MNKTEKKLFDAAYFESLDKHKRVHLINSIGGFKSVVLVGTKNNNNEENLSIFSSLVHIGANPPLVALIFRPSPPERDTLRNLLETGFYTINHINETIFKQAHQTSARFDPSDSEFEKVGLTPQYNHDFFAPFVAESKVQLGITFREKIDITINNTIMIIGEITHLMLPEEAICTDGFVNLEALNTITCSGLDSYHKTIQLDRLSYAKPKLHVTSLLSND
uniref:flavin reductase family protein n=1 Tax=Fluviicola sp. TaxID=1917219 RepID=UPI00404926E2